MTTPVARWLGERLANPYQVQRMVVLHCGHPWNVCSTACDRLLGTPDAWPTALLTMQYKYHGVGTQDRPLEHLLVEGANAEATASLR